MALDRRERRAELVRDRHQELALALLGRREPRGHLVEPLGEVRELRAPAAHRDLDGIVPGRDLVRGTGERLDGLADASREPEPEQPREKAADRDRGPEPQHERRPLVADDVLGLRDDDRPDRRAVSLEPHGLGGRDEPASLTGRAELELERPLGGQHLLRHRRLGQHLEPGVLAREGRRADVVELVAGRELERLGREVGRRRSLLGGAKRRVAVQPRDPDRLPPELLVRLVARVALEELHGDRRRDDAGDHDAEQEERGEPEAQRAHAGLLGPSVRRDGARCSMAQATPRRRACARTRPCSRRPTP